VEGPIQYDAAVDPNCWQTKNCLTQKLPGKQRTYFPGPEYRLTILIKLYKEKQAPWPLVNAAGIKQTYQ
jgi:hypothetical protein